MLNKKYHFGIYVAIFVPFFAFSLDAAMGDLLKASMIWHSGSDEKSIGFRKRFQVSDTAGQATLFVFADNRYVLWLNGNYVARGPCRFDPKRVEYDSVDVKPFLAPGANVIAVHVYGVISNGKSIRHRPGLTLRLEGNGYAVTTDTSWRCSNATRFREPFITWPDVQDRVNATLENGDFTEAQYDDASWSKAVKVDGAAWGTFHHRLTPLLRATEITSLSIGHPLPYDMPAGTLKITTPRCLLGYVSLDFEADAGSELLIADRHTYKARAGRQRYMTLDAFGFGSPDVPGAGSFSIQLKSGKIRLYGVKAYNYVYPFTLTARFLSNDNYLNRLWDVCTWSLMQNSEDGYIDCPWERAEWLGDAAVVEYPVTRVCFSGPAGGNNLLHGDPRLFGSILRHIALSGQSDGRLKAHAPSDRFDIHGYIEDYSCLWVQGVRQYFDCTGDTGFVNDVWPALTGQMKWFTDRVEPDGLVKAREFIIFDNPLKYKECEGATLNAFIYRALRDAHYLAEVVHKTSEAAGFKARADSLFTAFNKVLWNGQTYKASTADQPTLHAAVLALNRGIVPADREGSVRSWVLSTIAKGSIQMSYTHFWLFEELYKMNTDKADSIALDLMRTRWNNTWNANNPGFVTSESMSGGRNYHNFGAVPGFFLTAYVLGARRDDPVRNKRVVIEPRLGNLKNVQGIAVTEHGPIPVSWVRPTDSTLDFSFTVPAGASGRAGIPLVTKKNPTLSFDKELYVSKGTAVKGGVSVGDRFVFIDSVPAGSHSGRLQPGSLPVAVSSPGNGRIPARYKGQIRMSRTGTVVSIAWTAATPGPVTADLYTLQGRLAGSFVFRAGPDGNYAGVIDTRRQPLLTGTYCCRFRGPGLDKTLRVPAVR